MSNNNMASRITIVENILNANDQIASQNRQILNKNQVYSLKFYGIAWRRKNIFN